ncbi:MAG: hypothetical protein ACO1QS_06225 [Verrucomicrobiota bacterium]
MKLSYLIIVSLGLNAMLVAGVVHKRMAKVPAAESAAPDKSVAVEKGPAKAGTTVTETKTVVVDVPGEEFSWRRVEAADYHKYVANLRAIGCPEETVQDIIYSDVSKLYAEKYRALNRQYRYGSTAAVDYWSTEDTYRYSAERNRKYRELAEEKKALLIELLGVDLEKLRRERQGLPDYEALSWAYLPEAKRKQVQDIVQRFQDMEQETHQKYRNYYGEERATEMNEISRQRDAELAKLLSPQELEDYKVRSSQTAQQMKWNLAAFEPSEQEFRAMYKVEEALSNALGQHRYGGADPDDPAEQKKHADANKAKEEEMKKLLGEARYKEYTRAQDYYYQELYRMAQRSGLPKETVTKVFDMKDAAETQARQVRSDQNLTPEQRQQALAEIKNLTQKSIQDSLGEKNFKRYQSQGGWWLNNLAPETRTTVR